MSLFGKQLIIKGDNNKRLLTSFYIIMLFNVRNEIEFRLKIIKFKIKHIYS